MASQAERTVRQTQRAASDGPIGSALDVRVRDGVELSLTVTNNTRRAVELRFPNGHTHDFVILDEVGREVWRWSEERTFTSVVRTKLMKSGNSLTYATHWDPPVAHGKYVAVAELHSTNHPVTSQVQFTLP